jgi:N-acetylmuramoyl-L-alanine amidase
MKCYWLCRPIRKFRAGSWPTITPGPKPRIGIVAGHWGNDSGAVCADGLTEEKVNLRIATLVQQYLIAEGYEVDLLQEFDKRYAALSGINAGIYS